MSSKKKPSQKRNETPPAVRRWPVGKLAIPAVAVAAGLLIGVGWWRVNHPPMESARAAAEPVDEPTNDRQQDREEQLREVSAISPEFLKLKGQWVRSDGGYVIDIREVNENGKLDAAYLNPRPIHVAKAVASHDGNATKVFVELRDVNYPGSTYELIYDPPRDQLTGVYFQAVERQTFDVTFVRMK